MSNKNTQLTREFTFREKCVIGEVIYHCPGFQWSMSMGACGEPPILLAAPRPAASALSRDTASVFGVSPTFPNILSDEIHLSLTSERTFFSLLLFGRTESDNKSLLFSSTISFPGRQWVWNHRDGEHKLICLRRPAQLCPGCIVRLFWFSKKQPS